MRHDIDTVRDWAANGSDVAIATVVRSRGSAPRPIGSRFLVASDGRMQGSVSGGCVENDVYLHAEQVMASGLPKLLTYGISDEDAFEVGLSCGGSIQVFVEKAPDTVLLQLLTSEKSATLATVIAGGPLGARALLKDSGFLYSDLPSDLARLAENDAKVLRDGELSYALAYDNCEVFYESLLPAPRLVIVGAVEIARQLCAQAARIGFEVTVNDARQVFATNARFPEAVAVVVGWPNDVAGELALDGRTYLVLLSHDARFEEPMLRLALASSAPYIGAMGSRRTHSGRLDRLRSEGFNESDLARIHGPVGLSLGARTDGEVAIEILAEIIQARRAGFSKEELVGIEGWVGSSADTV